MTKKLGTRSAIFAALLAAWGMSGSALAVDEVEPNNPAASAQHLVIGSDGTVQVNGAIGSPSGPLVRDVDFYSFEARAGDIVTVDIGNARYPDGSGVDTVLAIFGPNSIDPLRQNDDAGLPLDANSFSTSDARIDNFIVEQTGTYVVGVSGFPSIFIDINTVASDPMDANSIGTYTLTISGVTPPVVTPPVVTPPLAQQINIDIRPGERGVARINLRSKQSIPVALLSSSSFDALKVDRGSLTFGKTGDESSLVRCNEHGADVNRDGLPDLVCHFDIVAAKFSVGDTEGIVKGRAGVGTAFEGRGWLKVLSGDKRRHGREAGDHEGRSEVGDHDGRREARR